MRLEEVLSHPPRVLTPEQRAFYFEQGYLHLEDFVSSDRIERLQRASARLVEQSRPLTESNDMFVLDQGHCAEAPRLRRLNRAVDYDDAFWEYASESSLPDLAADLIGPDVKFRESLINFKWARGGDEVRWHQDLPYYPHTNTCAILMLTCLEDVASDQAPLMVVPGSHHLGLLEHYDREDKWLGRVCDEDIERVPVEEAVELTGGAGTLIVLHGCIVHGSRHNHSDRNRPLLTCGYSAADAFCYTPFASGQASSHAWRIVRGKPARYAHHEAVRFRLPPDYSDTFTSIFEMQKGQQPRHARTKAGATPP